MEVLNDVLGYPNRKIYQDSNYFKFSLDGVLLANFVDLKKSAQSILDIGTGTGIIPLILSLKTNKQIDAIEIQEQFIYLCHKTFQYNHISDQIRLIHDDVKNYSKNKNYLNYYDVLISNPPYFLHHSSLTGKTKSKSQLFLTLEEFVCCSKSLLKDHGSLYFVYPSADFLKVCNLLHQNNFSIRKIQFVHHSQKNISSIFLVEAIKNGNTSTEVLPPFILYNDYEKMTEQYQKIYNGEVIIDESKKL